MFWHRSECCSKTSFNKGCRLPEPKFHWSTPKLIPCPSKSPAIPQKHSGGCLPVSNAPVRARQRSTRGAEASGETGSSRPGNSALQVWEFTTPSGGKPLAFWNSLSADSVPPPKMPSTGPRKKPKVDSCLLNFRNYAPEAPRRTVMAAIQCARGSTIFNNKVDLNRIF
jgi:hypothetical protein